MKKSASGADRKAFSLKERFNYWFDNRMARGSLGLIRSLVAASILLAVVVAALIVLFRLNGESDAASVFWDSIATIINAWMPSYEDGEIGYLILMALVAIAGVLFTSVLIGIITSTIEEKIIDLRKGNSRVLESDHIVVLGFYPGEYTLLRQLVLAAAEESVCIVVVEEMEREELEQAIRDNVDAPKNVRIVCRTADITDPADLEKCSVETCRTVIVSPTDDVRTVKTLLAVAALAQEKGARVRTSAILSRNEHRLPPSIAEANGITALQTNDTLAKMIAHSCTQTGLSETFREVFNFDGNEFFLSDVPGICGLTFGEAALRLDRAVPVGVYRAGRVVLNPPPDLRIAEGDRLLVFSEENDTAVLAAAKPGGPGSDEPCRPQADAPTDTVIIGYNATLPTILRELPENVRQVWLAGDPGPDEARALLEDAARERGFRLRRCAQDPKTEAGLLEIAKLAEHIVVLNDHEKEEEDADMESIFLILNLRDLRTRHALRFNITAEMRKERNQNLVAGGDRTDFVVASSMSSLCLAQLAESPELVDVFREILSNEGNELYLKSAAQLGLTGTQTVRRLRERALAYRYSLLGYLRDGGESVFNPPLDAEVTLADEDMLIILGED